MEGLFVICVPDSWGEASIPHGRSMMLKYGHTVGLYRVIELSGKTTRVSFISNT